MLAEHYNPFSESDTRNIKDSYKWWAQQRIVDDLDSHRSELIMAFLNTEKDMNLSSGIRNSCWFNAKETWVIGQRHWNRVGSVGSHNYIPVKRTPDFASAVEQVREQGYRIIGIEIDDRAVPITNYQWQARSFCVMGQESCGLSEEEMALCDDIVYVPGSGPIRSMNVSSTSAIVNYDYHMKMGLL